MSNAKVALVTGSGKRRVGWYVARALGRLGYQLAIHYRTSETETIQTVEEFRAEGIDATACQADLSDEPAVMHMFDQIHQHFGQLDVLVNCAAIWSPKRLEEVTADEVRQYFDVNTLSTFLCCRLGGLRMVGQETGGAIVNVGDWATARPYLNYAAYFASKGAIPTLTRTFAVELAARNPKVRVNCVLPGPVLLPIDLPEDVRQKSIGATLVKREGSPENVAQAVLHLVQNDFITGVCLPVDGGRSIHSSDD